MSVSALNCLEMHPDMTHLTIGGEIFKVEVEGDATSPAVLLSNSLGTDLSMWDAQAGELAKHFRVIRYDPRGHGGSGEGVAPASIAQLGTDALAILDALEVDKAHFIGLSMGGAVGLWLLVNAPQRIGRAVLANTAARLGSPEGWNARITSVLGGGMEQNAAATIERWFSPAFAEREPARVEAIHAMLRQASPQGYAHACAALRDMDLRAQLKTIENDVLVVTGRDDPVIPDEDASALVDAIVGAEQVSLAARHLSNIEARADFNAAVIAFLTRPARKAAAKAKPARTSTKASKTSPKTSPMKRGGAGRRSNAARSPLKKTPAKRLAAKRPAGKPPAAKRTARAATAKKAAAAHRRPATTRAATHRATAKATTKRPATKAARKTAARKTAATRRPTPTATARGGVTKKVTKRTAKKTSAKKTAAKGTTKKLPTARRKRPGKPRRPTGRRKT